MTHERANPAGRNLRYAYGAPIDVFLREAPEAILGALAAASEFADELSQKAAWQEEIALLKSVLSDRPESSTDQA